MNDRAAANHDDDTARVQALYQQRGIGTSTGYGVRPALLIIDMAVAFNDPSYAVGADQTETVQHIIPLLAKAREAGVGVIYTTTAYREDGSDAGMFGRKVPALLELTIGSPGVEIDPRLAPLPSEPVITKKFSSSFFGTNLLSMLIADDIDTLILTGCSTSGCIRAAALDGVSYGYHIIVPEECVSDRAEGPHRANLFDINAKYGDVVPVEDTITYLDKLAAQRA